MSEPGLRCPRCGNTLTQGLDTLACRTCGFNNAVFGRATSPPTSEPPPSSTSLADAHWSYIESLLQSHGVEPDEIQRIGFHYRTAFVHGYKHGVEDCK